MRLLRRARRPRWVPRALLARRVNLEIGADDDGSGELELLPDPTPLEGGAE